MKRKPVFLWCLGVTLLTAQFLVSAATAEIRFHPSNDSSELRYVIVSGEFEPADKLEGFTQLIKSHRPTFVVFHSNGGNPYKAMELGRLIRRHGLDTLQIKDLKCASACALAFLGGVNRVAEPGAIGVHKSSFSPEARLDVKEAVSAVQTATVEIMAYMSEMGVDPALMQLALRYEADDIRYLSKSEMLRLRVISPGPDLSPSASEKAERMAPAARTPQNLHERSRQFVHGLHRSFALENASILGLMKLLYDDKVHYFDEELSRDDVLTRIGRFLERWPMRDYKAQEPITVTCNEGAMQCSVRGHLRFDARSPVRSQRSYGTAEFSYTLRYFPDRTDPTIVAEGGKIIERRIVALPHQRDPIMDRGMPH